MTQILKYLNPASLVLLLGVAIAFPFVADLNTANIAILALIFAAAATGWNIFSGYTGYVALGHAAYFGVGAYTLAIICEHWKITDYYQPLYLIPVCGLVAGIFAIPLGAIALRTRRHTFVVITIATFFIMQLMAYNLHDLTGGSAGKDLPLPNWTPDFYNAIFYFTTLAVTLIALGVSWFIRHSKYGLGLLAIRDDEDRARGLGVPTGAFKLSAFVISAIFTGMAGAIFAYYLGSVQPQIDFDALLDVALALMVFMGGLGTLTGPILGALVLETAKIEITFQFSQDGVSLILYGALFLGVILLLPRGVVPTLQSLWRRYVVPLLTPPAAPTTLAKTATLTSPREEASV